MNNKKCARKECARETKPRSRRLNQARTSVPELSRSERAESARGREITRVGSRIKSVCSNSFLFVCDDNLKHNAERAIKRLNDQLNDKFYIN